MKHFIVKLKHRMSLILCKNILYFCFCFFSTNLSFILPVWPMWGSLFDQFQWQTNKTSYRTVGFCSVEGFLSLGLNFSESISGCLSACGAVITCFNQRWSQCISHSYSPRVSHFPLGTLYKYVTSTICSINLCIIGDALPESLPFTWSKNALWKHICDMTFIQHQE